MRRRELIFALGGAAAWPLAARAQPALPVVGFLSSASPEQWAPFVTAFRQGLSEGGYFESRNVVIEFRWASGRYDRLPELAAELVRLQVSVIIASGGGIAPVAAKSVTTTIPIVFAIGADPVKIGLVDSLNQPGGNLTGVSFLINALGAKRLQLIHELVPSVTRIAVLSNPGNPSSESGRKSHCASDRSRTPA